MNCLTPPLLGDVASTVISEQEGSGFDYWGGGGVCMFLCLCGFSPGALAFTAVQKHPSGVHMWQRRGLHQLWALWVYTLPHRFVCLALSNVALSHTHMQWQTKCFCQSKTQFTFRWLWMQIYPVVLPKVDDLIKTSRKKQTWPCDLLYFFILNQTEVDCLWIPTKTVQLLALMATKKKTKGKLQEKMFI